MEVKMIKVVILQAIGGLNYNYSPNQVVEIAEKRAEVWAEKGICRILTEAELTIQASATHTDAPKADNEGGEGESTDPDGCDLPEDLPARDIFIENDIITMEAVRNYGDWTELTNIGPATSEELTVYFEKIDNPDGEA